MHYTDCWFLPTTKLGIIISNMVFQIGQLQAPQLRWTLSPPAAAKSVETAETAGPDAQSTQGDVSFFNK